MILPCAVGPRTIPPVVLNRTYSTFEDTALAVAAPGLLQGATDADGDPITVLGYTQPAHGTVVVASNGSFTYVPGPNFNGRDSFTANITDSFGGYASATISIQVGECAWGRLLRGWGFALCARPQPGAGAAWPWQRHALAASGQLAAAGLLDVAHAAAPLPGFGGHSQRWH